MTEEKTTSLKERLAKEAANPESPLLGCKVSVRKVMDVVQEEYMLLGQMTTRYREDLSPETLRAFTDMMGKELTPKQQKWVRDEARRLGILA